MTTLVHTLVMRTLRVPAGGLSEGIGGEAMARRFDSALMSVGFKLSKELLAFLATRDEQGVRSLAVETLTAVRQLVGAHVTHNAYFINFPENVPDTLEFWASKLSELVIANDSGSARHVHEMSAEELLAAAEGGGTINLLELPGYGTYNHTFADLVEAHDAFLPGAKDRVTLLHLGGTTTEEADRLYWQLATSTVPLKGEDRTLLDELVGCALSHPHVTVIPVRENRAIINARRMRLGMAPVQVDTVTDVLRIAAALSDGDVTLERKTEFGPFPRASRRALLHALEAVVAADQHKVSDVPTHEGAWKRLGEYLHPHEYVTLPHAQEVFKVARGERTVRTLAGRVELLLKDGDLVGAREALAIAPGALLRSADRLLRSGDSVLAVSAAIEKAAPEASARVLFSLREHLMNRADTELPRVFVGRSQRAWVTPDTRPPLPEDVTQRVASVLDHELGGRLAKHLAPESRHVVLDPVMSRVAVPVSGKGIPEGLAMMPRGSRIDLEGDTLRFFTYWRQRSKRTDFDLSALLLDENFGQAGHISWTSYHGADGAATYSGDIVDAPDGATEFIDINLNRVLRNGFSSPVYVVPQVFIFTGEDFGVTGEEPEAVAESMFGFMSMDRAQKGMPFEPQTVRARSEMRGRGQYATPAVFAREGDRWVGIWTHLYGRGMTHGSRVEQHKMSTALLAQAAVRRNYLTVGLLGGLLAQGGASVVMEEEATLATMVGSAPESPLTYIGLQAPDVTLPEGSTVITLENLSALVPE